LYSILPHRGDWKAADVTRRGFELNNPLIARTPLVHAGRLPAVHSFVKAGPAGVIVSALKKEMGYAERGLILRLYETKGEKTEARIELPWPVEARAADLIERQSGQVIGTGQVLTVSLAPYEIKTIRIERK
jgi:alpha-mannosidase